MLFFGNFKNNPIFLRVYLKHDNSHHISERHLGFIDQIEKKRNWRQFSLLYSTHIHTRKKWEKNELLYWLRIEGRYGNGWKALIRYYRLNMLTIEEVKWCLKMKETLNYSNNLLHPFWSKRYDDVLNIASIRSKNDRGTFIIEFMWIIKIVSSRWSSNFQIDILFTRSDKLYFCMYKYMNIFIYILSVYK